MYTWEKLRQTEELTKMAEATTVNTIFSERQRRVLGVVVWDFKGEGDNLYGDGNANT